MNPDVSSIGKGCIKANSPFVLKTLPLLFLTILSISYCIAEDRLQHDNRVYADSKKTDKYGAPALMVHHRYCIEI
jgi:hypothetical protein